MTTLTARWPPTPLPYAKGQNEEPGYSDLLAVDGAALATLHGHVMGGDQVGGDTPNPAPVNPSGDLGHDHSGGFMGRPLFRTIATLSFDDGRSYTTNIDAGTHYGSFVIEDAGDGDVTRPSRAREVPLWVPPCDPGVDANGNPIGAYKRLGICITCELEATALVSGDEVHLEVERLGGGLTSVAELDFTLSTSPTSAGTILQAVSTNLATRLQMQPGRFNVLRIVPYVDRQGTGSDRGCTIDLQEIELGVYET